ncbi:unnamed protein product, partial [Sphacelaria rigidula]
MYQEKEMQIFIRGLTDRTHIFQVFPSDTVARVKKQVHQRLGVPPIHLRLMFNGRQLDSNKTLSDHNVDKESTLEGAIRLRGGKPVILLYPPSPLDASVHLSLNFGWKFSTLYPAPSREKVGPYDHAPAYDECTWTVRANPDGTLKDMEARKEYPYLFWEADSD